MDQLKNAVKLDQSIGVMIPGTKGAEKINNSLYVEKALYLFADLFGGSTSIEGAGAYISISGELIQENVNKVYSFTDDIGAEKLARVFEFVDQLKNELFQECIGVEINGAFYLV